MASAKKRLSRIQRLRCLGIMVAMHNTPAGIAPEALTCPPPTHTRVGVSKEARLVHIDSGVWDAGPTITQIENH